MHLPAWGSFPLVALTIVLPAASAQAQEFSVIHRFQGQADGANPTANLTPYGTGTFYGTTLGGGLGGGGGNGVVFKLHRTSSGWMLTPIYEFAGRPDAGGPTGGVVVGPDGALYGTTSGAGAQGYGAVYRLMPPFTVCKTSLCYWNESVLYSFDYTNGGYPGSVNPAFDRPGNMYGTTIGGGTLEGGVLWKLSRSGGQWAETVIHTFGLGDGGVEPQSGVVFDAAGNLYGTTLSGGQNQCEGSFCGVVYQLVPHMDGTWSENVLFNFDTLGDGSYPFDAPFIDQAGNLYGTTYTGGPNDASVVFQLSPSNGWTYFVLYNLPGPEGDSCYSETGVVKDAAGNLFGVCYNSGVNDQGFVFELTQQNGTWSLQHLHDFTGGSDGALPVGGLTLDASGDLYGTTQYGGNTGGACGASGCGVIWEITGVTR